MTTYEKLRALERERDAAVKAAHMELHRRNRLGLPT